MNNKNETRLMCRWLAVGVGGGAALAALVLSVDIVPACVAFAKSPAGVMLGTLGVAAYIARWLAREGSR